MENFIDLDGIEFSPYPRADVRQVKGFNPQTWQSGDLIVRAEAAKDAKEGQSYRFVIAGTYTDEAGTTFPFVTEAPKEIKRTLPSRPPVAEFLPPQDLRPAG